MWNMLVSGCGTLMQGQVSSSIVKNYKFRSMERLVVKR